MEVFTEGENGFYESAVRYRLSGMNSVPQIQQPLQLLILKMEWIGRMDPAKLTFISIHSKL